MAQISHSRGPGERQRLDVCPGDGKTTAVECNVLGGDLHHLRCDLFCLLDNAPGANMDSGSADRHRTRIEGAVAGLDLLRVALHDVDILDRHLQHIGGDLRQRGRVPVTLAHRAGIQRRAAARIHGDARAFPAAAVEAVGREPARGRHTAHLGVGSDANASITSGRSQTLLLLAPPTIVECRDGLFETW